LGGISIKLRGFFTGVAERVGPMLLDVLERIDKIDLTGIGQNIGDAVMMLMESFRDGTFGDIIWLSMKAAWEQMVNYFTRVVVPAIASGFEAAAEAAIETTLKLGREIKGAVSDLLPTPPEDEMTGQSGRSLIASLVSTFRRVGGETLGGESAQRQALIMQRETSKATLDVAKNTRETNRLLSNLNLTPSYV
jgi:hypothetical protein